MKKNDTVYNDPITSTRAIIGDHRLCREALPKYAIIAGSIDLDQCGDAPIVPTCAINHGEEGGMQVLLPRQGRRSIVDVIVRLWQSDLDLDSWPMRSRKGMTPAAPLAEDAIASVEDLRAASELRALIDHGPDEAFLLLRRMVVLGIDPDELARIEPVVFRNLHSRCTTCESQGRCAWDIADDIDPSWKEPPDGWQGYCPNVAELSALLEMPWFRSDIAPP